MKPYQVLVVDDSAFMRKIISDLIENDTDFKVVATAINGREAIDKISELKPDLVTMDVEMPVMNGLEALKIIMATNPLPVIMLSGINEEGMRETILALESGAFDFIRKPSVSNSQDITAVGESLRMQMKEAMLARQQRKEREEAALPQPNRMPGNPASQKLTAPKAGQPLPPGTARSISASKPVQESLRAPKPADKRTDSARVPLPPANPGDKLKGIQRPAAQNSVNPAVNPAADRRIPDKPAEAEAKPVIPSPARQPEPLSTASAGGQERGVNAKGLRKLVAVGCSTGGPRALKTLLEQIPADFPAPVVIVQHMPPNFTKSLAQRLNTFSPLEVMEAEHGMILRPGAAYIAPGGYHMKVTANSSGQYMIALSQEDARNGHRPSVDTLFESLLPLTSLERHAVIMTGMGADGAKMMKALYDSGVRSTFAESAETCVVYGMPRSAVELQCVSHVLPLHDIAPRLVQGVK